MLAALFWAFVIGGATCVLAQLIADIGPFTPAHIMVLFVVLGVIAGAIGVFDPFIKLAGAGATIPLSGFGAALAKGVVQETDSVGWLGLFTGAFKATGAGIKAAIVFAFLAALVAKPRH